MSRGPRPVGNGDTHGNRLPALPPFATFMTTLSKHLRWVGVDKLLFENA